MPDQVDDILSRHAGVGNRKYTPRDQGDLQDSLRIFKQKSPKGWIYSFVWDSDHAKYVNKRNPFVKKTIAYAVRKLKKELGERTGKEWRKANVKISRVGTRRRGRYVVKPR